MGQSEVERLIYSELESFRIQEAREELEKSIEVHLSEPRWEDRPDAVAFWNIASRPNGTRILFAEDPLDKLFTSSDGRKEQWVVAVSEDTDIGLDMYWFYRLEDAFFQSGWDGEMPENYEVE